MIRSVNKIGILGCWPAGHTAIHMYFCVEIYVYTLMYACCSYLYKFIYCQKSTNHSISWFLHPNRNWNRVPPFDFNSKFQTHTNNRTEFVVISFPFWIWNFQTNSILDPIQCIQTQRQGIGQIGHSRLKLVSELILPNTR
jgi:hypothetical protein